MAKLKSFDPGMQKKMKQEIQDLLRRGIIRPSILSMSNEEAYAEN